MNKPMSSITFSIFEILRHNPEAVEDVIHGVNRIMDSIRRTVKMIIP